MLIRHSRIPPLAKVHQVLDYDGKLVLEDGELGASVDRDQGLGVVVSVADHVHLDGVEKDPQQVDLSPGRRRRLA